ncbi:MAG: phosphatidate cytidylyltransferase [Bacteroidota bacterium]|nr:phosphatidate cytidylyltransferase [Bacteroidota bacterium]MDP4245167.1 phosphatidate cytidylyltransferase [Bacteroidota bacterium]MDP4253209.1 phosphatidate cytidylyltransferase [Bacteroidota bacterium]MDP4258247.1 phosphatidate cytidylyltransferase [Bacteroidota bacterium]
MALNLPILRTRTLTAAVFVLVMLTGLLWNQWSFFVLFSIIHFGCWTEYQRIIALIDPRYKEISPFHRYGVMIAGWSLMLFFTSDIFHIGDISLHKIGWWAGLALIFVLPAGEVILSRQIQLRNIGYSLLGLLYISLPWGLLMNMRSYSFGPLADLGWVLALVIVGSIWINDTMAYMVGSLIGKRPLTKISPKKTWEGTIGGILLSILVMASIGYYVGDRLDDSRDWNFILQWAVIAAIASVAGTFGDLLESKLKRMANVKDSGHIMPGHGGFLDRFDSMLVAIPFVWLYVVLVLMR